jgi:hypothetical protein
MKKLMAALLVTALAFVSVSCGKSPKMGYGSHADSYVSESQSAAEWEYQAEIERDLVTQAAAVTEGIPAQRKLVKRADIRIRVENLAAAGVSLSALMEQHGAYSEETTIHEDSRRYTIRVPDAAFSAFLTAAGGMGRTLYRSETAEDVTIRYYDLEGRLATKRELLKTYQSYLGRAKNIEEILSVESRIADLQNEIDGTGKELRRLAGLTEYAVVTLNIVGPVSSAPYRGQTLGERLKEMFASFGGFLATAAVVITGIVIYGIPITLLLAVFFWLFFGRVGLLKKLIYLAAGKKPAQKMSTNTGG